MEVIRNGTHYDGTAVALGNFDGLHVAHMTIIRNCIDYANNPEQAETGAFGAGTA